MLKNINELRIVSTKKTGIKTNYFLVDGLAVDERDYSTVKQMFDEIEGEIELTITSSDEIVSDKKSSFIDECSYKIRGRVIRDNENSEFSREAITNLCKEYVIFLEEKIDCCVSLFATSLVTNKI